MTHRQLAGIITLVLLLAVSVLGQTPNHVRTITGTYVCIACDLEKNIGAHSQCSIYGHNYGIRLADGSYIHLLANDHSVDLVKGGGRINFPISVNGIYDRAARTIDVQKYSIDGIQTSWSEASHKMETPMTHRQLASGRTVPSAKPDTQLTRK